MILNGWDDIQVSLNNSHVIVNRQNVECKVIDSELRAKRTKDLVNHIPKIASTNAIFLENVQEAGTGESDSGDEGVPRE